jgi:hypothetical protein
MRRYGNYEDFITQLDKVEGGLEKFALGYKQFGPQVFFVIHVFKG